MLGFLRYSQKADGTTEFDDQILIQKGAYTFFDFEPPQTMRHQLIGLWQLTGVIDPFTGQRAPWKDAIAPTVEFDCYQNDGTNEK